ncbi:MAG: RHS repeat-associated core domain-containing protein [Bacteroidota bacterium]|nr:RHS repeat-associated core domain-containing protein [Bacteroidota bacterium]
MQTSKENTAIVDDAINGKSMNYILKDHLGSYNVTIADENGNKLEEMSFDAWGQRRNPDDWSNNNVPTNFLFRRGFTSHEHLDEFGLINMNGRVYDNALGRFLSPDPFVQMPDFSRALTGIHTVLTIL